MVSTAGPASGVGSSIGAAAFRGLLFLGQGRLETVAHLLADELLERFPGDLGELLSDGLGHAARIDLRGEEPHELLGRLVELLVEDALDLAGVLEIAGVGQDGAHLETALGELLELGEHEVVHGQEIDLQERPGVHLVRGFEIGEEAVDHAVGQDSDAGGRDREVAVELGRMALIEAEVAGLALEKHDGLAVLENGIVDLLTLLDADIGVELGSDLEGVEHVVAEGAEERQHQGVLGGFLGAEVWDLGRDAGGKLPDAVGEIHAGSPLESDPPWVDTGEGILWRGEFRAGSVIQIPALTRR